MRKKRGSRRANESEGRCWVLHAGYITLNVRLEVTCGLLGGVGDALKTRMHVAWVLHRKQFTGFLRCAQGCCAAQRAGEFCRFLRLYMLTVSIRR